MMKRIVALLLAALLVFTGAAMAEGKTVSEEPVTLKYAVSEVPVSGCSYADPLPVWKVLEEVTGVTIDWDVIPTEYQTVMSTRIASNSNLPDVMMDPGGSVSTLMNGSVFARLNDLIDAYGPNISRILGENPALVAEMYTPDGSLCALPTRVFTMQNYSTNPMCFMVRRDWMKKVGITDEPTTIEEWHALLQAFREKDPNGNGEKDETPFCTNLGMMRAFSEAWGLDPLTDFDVKDGQVRYQWTTEEARDFIATMAQWYAEGLIAPDYLTDRNLDARHLENQTGASFMWAASNCSWQNTNNTTPGTDWNLVPPPRNVYTGEEGFLPVSAKDLYSSKTLITTVNDKAELAVKYLNYLWSDEGTMYTCMGVEGDSYVYNENGEPVFTEKIQDGGNWYANTKAYGLEAPICHVTNHAFCKAQIAAYSDEINAKAASVLPYIRVSMPSYMASEEEDMVISIVYTDIKTYADEMINKFITGSEPMDRFDSFVGKIESMGLAEVVAVKQAQYDRNN